MNLLRLLRTRRPRARLAWLALLALLFQQVALASYTCPTAVEGPPAQSIMADCEGMEMPDPDAPLLCDQHCLRDHVASADAKAPQVPPLALPPVHFALTEASIAPAQALYYEDVPTCRSDPPAAQRFCSLQI